MWYIYVIASKTGRISVMTPLRAASVCAGIGGVDLGFVARVGCGVRLRVENALSEKVLRRVSV